MNRTVSLGLFAIGLCVLGWFAWSTGGGAVGASGSTSGESANSGLTAIEANSGAQGSEDSLPSTGSSGSEANTDALGVGNASFQASQAIGPQSLTQKNEARLDAFATEIAARDARFRDFYTLAQSEESDAEWSDQIEKQLQQAVAIHGARLNGIQTRPPHCTRTVCMLVATGGMGTEVANADWQRLMAMVMGEPWFGANFVDTQSSMQGDPKGVMYITFFIRKL